MSATFRRGENLSFWKWLVYNQLLRRSQKMSMLGHLDEHMMDRFLKNFEEVCLLSCLQLPSHLLSLGPCPLPMPLCRVVWKLIKSSFLPRSITAQADVFGVRVPEIYDDIPVTDVFKQIQEVPIDDEGNPLDVLDEMERKLDSRGTGIGADLEAVDVQYDEWGAERVDMDSRGTAGGTSGAAGSESRASTGFFSKTKKTSADLEDLGEEAVEPKKKGLFSRKKK